MKNVINSKGCYPFKRHAYHERFAVYWLLKDAFSLVCAENKTPHLLPGKAINQLVDLALNILLIRDLLTELNLDLETMKNMFSEIIGRKAPLE